MSCLSQPVQAQGPDVGAHRAFSMARAGPGRLRPCPACVRDCLPGEGGGGWAQRPPRAGTFSKPTACGRPCLVSGLVGPLPTSHWSLGSIGRKGVWRPLALPSFWKCEITESLLVVRVPTNPQAVTLCAGRRWVGGWG